MSREDRIVSKLEFIEYVYENYPNIVKEWKNKSGFGNQPNTNTDEQPIQVTNQNRHV